MSGYIGVNGVAKKWQSSFTPPITETQVIVNSLPANEGDTFTANVNFSSNGGDFTEFYVSYS